MTMRYMDEFRDAEIGRALSGKILEAVEPGRHYKLMEVCGGHTHSIYKYGIDDLLPENVELVHGPGSPCLRDPHGTRRRRDRDGHRERHHLHLLRRHDARARVGEDADRGEGRRCGHPHGVFAARRAADRAKQNPDREVVFFAIGFETTAPSTRADREARAPEGVTTSRASCNHVTIVPPLRALLGLPGTCASTASSARATSRPWWAAGPSSRSSRGLRQARRRRRDSSRSTSCRRSA